MRDETATGPAEETDGGGHSRRSRGEPAPLQSRAKFLQNWDWVSVTQIHDGLCERGRAQPGINAETHPAVAQEWEERRSSELTLSLGGKILRVLDNGRIVWQPDGVEGELKALPESLRKDD